MATDGEVAAAVQAALGRAPEAVTRLPGGANNVVARVVVDGKPLLAKVYFTHPGDSRDRLGTEFGTLQFLWRNGVRRVPEPLLMDRERRLGLYAFVGGPRLARGEVGRSDALQLVDLLAEMWALRLEPQAASLPRASEAAFTVRAYLAGVEARLRRLTAALASAADADEARVFVRDVVAPAVGAVGHFVVDRAPSLGVELDRELPLVERTLSPADFGFHNALRRPDGRLVFIDFEYAGWDDPANALAQACLAPEVPLPPEHRLLVLDELLRRLEAGVAVVARLRLVYPLLALRWSMIVLNEFLAVGAARRTFAGVDPARREGQIPKSRLLVAAAEEAIGERSFLDALAA